MTHRRGRPRRGGPSRPPPASDAGTSATWPGSRNNVPSCGPRCPATALMALEDAQRARLRAAGTALVALDIAVRVAIDNVLAAQAQLPTFEVWRQQEAAC